MDAPDSKISAAIVSREHLDCATKQQTGTVSTVPQPMTSFDGGLVGGSGYASLSGFKGAEASTLSDDGGPRPYVPPGRCRKVIIVGAGVSGIQQAAILLRDGCVKLDDMQIFDALGGFGGVWEKNNYPGCACDVPAMIYTTSFHVNKKWDHFYATRAQIQDYYSEFAHHYKLQHCTQFKSFVSECHWDAKEMAWYVAVQQRGKDNVEYWKSDTICQCVGSLDRPKFGNTPGREQFEGDSWHTAHWRHDYDLSGKNVAIVGCGPSAAQIIPEIVDRVEHLTVYIRTPPVCVPRNDFAYSRLFRWALAWIPFFASFVRWRMSSRMIRMGMDLATDNSSSNEEMNATAARFMESQVKDPALREILRPNSKYYCKRPLRLDNFYTSLAKPNCTVLCENLITYTKTGLISADKKTGHQTERPFDVIIFGTGFNASQYLEHEKIYGLNGRELQQAWKYHPEALYGVATHGFPNMFMCFGPNSATVWSSQQDIWEQQARFNTKLIRSIVQKAADGEILAVHPSRAVEKEYNQQVQNKQLGRFVWARPDCVSYYKNDAGWNTFTMPWSLKEFTKMLSKIRWGEWVLIKQKMD